MTTGQGKITPEASQRGFICAGCWTRDHIKLIDKWPGEEGLSRITGTDHHGGGSAHNLGIDIRTLDASMPVDAIGLIGNDPDGDFLFHSATTAGMDTTQLKRSDKAETSYTDVMSVSSSGKRTFFHHAGANDLLTPDDFVFQPAGLQSDRKILHLGLLGVHHCLDNPWLDDPCGWVTVLRKARLAGLKTNIELVSITPDRIRQIGLPCLPWLDTLIVNDYEIGGLTDIQTINHGKADPELCRKAAQAAMLQGSMEFVVVHYPEGAVCVTSDGEVIFSQSVTVDPDTIGSTVGAGDAFAAGLLYAIHENWPIRNALELAHATAASSLRSNTTVGSVEDVDSCLELAGYQRPPVNLT